MDDQMYRKNGKKLTPEVMKANPLLAQLARLRAREIKENQRRETAR
jgi:hypothetical protein